MSIELFRVLHISGLLMLFTGLAAFWAGFESEQPPKKSLRALAAALHGLGLLLLLVSGAGLASGLGYWTNIPSWMIAKLLIFLILAATFGFVKRKPRSGATIVFIWIFLGIAATYLALLKPF